MTQRFWFHVCFDFCFDGLLVVVVLALAKVVLAPTPYLLFLANDALLCTVSTRVQLRYT